MAFDNPIVAGEKLIREAIQSPDYVAGATGWSINKDGTVEFNEATIRGSVVITGPEGQVEIILDDGVRPIIKLWNAAHTNFAYLNIVDDLNPDNAPLGINSGILPSVANPGRTVKPRLYFYDHQYVGLEFVDATNPAALFPLAGVILGEKQVTIRGKNSLQMAGVADDDTTLASVNIYGTTVNKGAIFMQGSASGTARDTAQVVLGNGSGLKYLRLFGENFKALDFTGSTWSATAAGTPDVSPGYRVDPAGCVHFEGRIEGGTNAVGQLLFTMPVGYRPHHSGRWTCAQGSSSAGADPAIFINADTGQAILSRVAGTGAFIYLNNISYMIE